MSLTDSWTISECVVFRKTKEKWGGLSHMAGGYPIRVGPIETATSESLYQACRFPNDMELQRAILEEKNPMKAKFIAKGNASKTRSDWDAIRVRVMAWALGCKLASNPAFGELLLETREAPIVEYSSRDPFWGATPSKSKPEVLVGHNALGRLLSGLRRDITSGSPTSMEDWFFPTFPNASIRGVVFDKEEG